MFINYKSERYCYKCHSIKHISKFTRRLFTFKDAGKCVECVVSEGKKTKQTAQR